MMSLKQESRMIAKARRRGRRNCRAGQHVYEPHGMRITAIDQERAVVTFERDPDSAKACAWCGLMDLSGLEVLS